MESHFFSLLAGSRARRELPAPRPFCGHTACQPLLGENPSSLVCVMLSLVCGMLSLFRTRPLSEVPAGNLSPVRLARFCPPSPLLAGVPGEGDALLSPTWYQAPKVWAALIK